MAGFFKVTAVMLGMGSQAMALQMFDIFKGSCTMPRCCNQQKPVPSRQKQIVQGFDASADLFSPTMPVLPPPVASLEYDQTNVKVVELPGLYLGQHDAEGIGVCNICTGNDACLIRETEPTAPVRHCRQCHEECIRRKQESDPWSSSQKVDLNPIVFATNYEKGDKVSMNFEVCEASRNWLRDIMRTSPQINKATKKENDDANKTKDEEADKMKKENPAKYYEFLTQGVVGEIQDRILKEDGGEMLRTNVYIVHIMWNEVQHQVKLPSLVLKPTLYNREDAKPYSKALDSLFGRGKTIAQADAALDAEIKPLYKKFAKHADKLDLHFSRGNSVEQVKEIMGLYKKYWLVDAFDVKRTRYADFIDIGRSPGQIKQFIQLRKEFWWFEVKQLKEFLQDSKNIDDIRKKMRPEVTQS